MMSRSIRGSVQRMAERGAPEPEPRLLVLDTSVVIEPLDDYTPYGDATAITAVTIGELAFGLHHVDPMVAAQRERVYRETLEDYDPIPYDATAAHYYGAIASAVSRIGRNPRPRTADLMIAAVARSVGASVLTRNPDDFRGLETIVPVVAVTSATG